MKEVTLHLQKIISLFLVLILLLLTSCTPSDDPLYSGSFYQKISAKKAKTMLDVGGVVLVDVRTQEEFDQGHIEGAILVPSTEIASVAPDLLPDKGVITLVYCRSGVRSEAATKTLIDLGYSNVYDIGGILTWPYETTPPSEAILE